MAAELGSALCPVLLDRMRDNAEATGIHTLRIEAPEGRSLPANLALKTNATSSCEQPIGGT